MAYAGGGLRRIRHIMEFAAARIFLFVIARLPLPASSALCRFLAGLYRLIAGKRRRIAETQAAEILGLSPAGARELIKRNFRHYGLVMAEAAQLSRLCRKDFSEHLDLAGLDVLANRLFAEGRGIILVTAHFGNWEWGGSGFSCLSERPGCCIARPFDNPLVYGLVKNLRGKNGLRIFDKQGALRQALRALKNNEYLAILMDQDAGRDGLGSPFLGRPASTVTEPVKLALRTGSPLVPVVLRRREGAARRFVMRYNPVPRRADPAARPEAEIRRLVDLLNADLSRLILEAPEQWFWVHRRWKNPGRIR
ncbi:MAG: lysophospholipid acyltransferase family protein [Planctomycetota bacterium]|jgi:KDO2-lipid IV(A) lauroyltransferase|nr:lysophospholipid acyltransferase family protein [Planctomycetota bacterium]